PGGLAPESSGAAQKKVADFARENQKKEGELAGKRDKSLDEKLGEASKGDQKADGSLAKAASEAKSSKDAYDQARQALQQRNLGRLHVDRLGVDLSCQMSDLKTQCRVQQTALRNVANRNCLELGGVWIDEGFNDKMPLVTVKAMSDAYFRILERH